MNQAANIILFGTFVVGSVACVPIPHRYYYDPNIEGEVTIKEASADAVRATLFRCTPTSNACKLEHSVDSVQIDEFGSFRLKGSRKFAAYATPMAHCNWRWTVKFHDSESELLGAHVFGVYGPCVAPNLVRLQCSMHENEVRCDSSGI